jgi:hypothetical protein
MQAIDDSMFVDKFEYNRKDYAVFDGEKTFQFESENESITENKKKIEFKLRRVYIWNKSTGKRTCALSWEKGPSMNVIECAKVILNRWGASENTFKHILDRHPFHYHPGFKMTESENQEIHNPKIKEYNDKIGRLKTELSRQYKKYAKAKDSVNKDGSIRSNSPKKKLKEKIEHLESEIRLLSEEKNRLPEKIDIGGLEDYRKFKTIDNEGKNLFDFVTCSVWNARKQLTDWLLPFYNDKNEYIDLFYAITESHGWIKSEKDKVVVRLEPLQQSSRRKAQEQLCKKLSALGAHTPKGKRLEIEVGTSPIKN